MTEITNTLKGWLIPSKDKKLKEIDAAIKSNDKEIKELNSRIDAIQATLNGEDMWFVEDSQGR